MSARALAPLVALLAITTLAGCAELQRAWQEDHCHYDGAYADGMNDARTGSPMNPASIADACPPQTRPDVQAGYRDGYTNGAATVAPPHHPHRRGYRGLRDTGQPYCRYGTDCRGAGFCRDRGDGVRVCMDHGRRGDYCRFGTDCRGSLFCKDRGDGIRVCM